MFPLIRESPRKKNSLAALLELLPTLSQGEACNFLKANPMSKQVSCINKRGNHYNAHERIQAIGGVANGYRWKDSEATSIANVKRDASAYYTSVNGKSAWLVIATHNGREYLKTENDGYSPDNLLSLPECP
jgi:hypothetical protein